MTDPALSALASRADVLGNQAVGVKSVTVAGAPAALDAVAAVARLLSDDIAAYTPPPVIDPPPPPPITGPDLVIVGADLGIANQPVTVGQVVRVKPTATAKNQGGTDIPATTTLGMLVGINPPIDPATGKLKPSDQWGAALAYSDTEKGLAAGATKTLTCNGGTDAGFITIPTATAGDVTIALNVDNPFPAVGAQGRVQESDETNNVLLVHVTVQPATTPPPPPPPPPGTGGMTLNDSFFLYPGFGGTSASEVVAREAQRNTPASKFGILQMTDTTSPGAMESNLTSGYVTGARSWIPNTGGAAAVNTLGMRRMVFSIPTAFANGVNCAAVAQGKADTSYLNGFRSAKRWLDAGFDVHLRFAWEGDGNWMQWAIERNSNTASTCNAALLHVIALAKQVDARFVIGWCGTMRWWEAQTPKWDTLVPASISALLDEFIYDAYPRQHAGLDPGADGKGGYVKCYTELDAWLAKPENVHLKVGLGEWSGGQTGGPGGGVTDWLEFTTFTLNWFKKYVDAGRASYQSWFDVFEGTEQADYRIASHPRSGALWASIR